MLRIEPSDRSSRTLVSLAQALLSASTPAALLALLQEIDEPPTQDKLEMEWLLAINDYQSLHLGLTDDTRPLMKRLDNLMNTDKESIYYPYITLTGRILAYQFDISAISVSLSVLELIYEMSLYSKDVTKILLTDHEPTTCEQNFLYSLLTLYKSRVLKWRQLVENELIRPTKTNIRADDTSFDSQLLLQLKRDTLLQFDAVLMRLNLSGDQDLRTLYNSHLKKNKLRDVTKEPNFNYRHHAVLSCLTANNLDTVKLATENLTAYLAKYEYLLTSYLLFKKTNLRNGDHDKLFIHHLHNLYFDARIMYAQVNACDTDNESLYATIRDLDSLIRISAAMLYILNKENCSGLETIILNTTLTSVNVTSSSNDIITRMLSHLYLLKLQILLDSAEDSAERINIFLMATNNMLCFLEIYKVKASSIHSCVLSPARQFILDYYLFALLQCNHLSELKFVISTEIYESIIYLAREKPQLATIDTSEFIRHYVLLCLSRSWNNPANSVNPYKDLPKSTLTLLMNDCLKVFSSFSNNTFKVNSTIYTYVVLNIRSFMSYMKSAGDPDQQKSASTMVSNIDLFFSAVTRNNAPIIENLMPSKVNSQPVRIAAVDKSSFETGPIVKPIDPRKNKVKSVKKSAVPEPQNPNSNHLAVKLKPTVKDRFTDVVDFFNRDINDVQQFYTKYLQGHDRLNHFHSMLGLAECLTLITDMAKRDKLGEFLTISSPPILKFAASYFANEEYMQCKARYEDLILNWMQNKESRKPKQKTIVAREVIPQPAPPVAKVKVKKSFPQTLPASPSFFKAVQKPDTDEKKPPVCRVVAIPPEVFSEFSIKTTMKITLTSAQEKLINLLHAGKMSPLVHGGAVIDSLFSIPYRDVDLLCFSSADQLKKVLEQHYEELKIKILRKNKYSDVFILSIDSGCGEEEIELAFINSIQDNKNERLRQLARGFGINTTLYFDPIKCELIDPLRQYDRLINCRVLDVSQVVTVDLNNYFENNPERILDGLNKVSKYRKYDIRFTISENVSESIKSNLKQLTACLSSVFNMNRFDKFFLSGYAAHSFDVLTQHEVLQLYFPMLTLEDLASFRAACDEFDRDYDAKDNTNMTPPQLEEMRAKLIAGCLYGCFIQHAKLNGKPEDKNEYYRSCATFLDNMNLFKSRELIPRIQDIWWDRLVLECQSRARNLLGN